MSQAFVHDSPIGQLLIKHDGHALLEIKINPQGLEAQNAQSFMPLPVAQKQLDEYFEGKRQRFTLPYRLQGTAFQKKVYLALLDIPYGTTQSYADIAGKIGHTKAYRAVGSANHVNRLPVIVPCHRVIGSSGKLVGFRGGLDTKSWMLNHEKQNRGSSIIP